MRAPQFVKAAAVAVPLIAVYLLVRTGPLAPAHGISKRAGPAISNISGIFVEGRLT